jgi:hypothetical protein
MPTLCVRPHTHHAVPLANLVKPIPPLAGFAGRYKIRLESKTTILPVLELLRPLRQPAGFACRPQRRDKLDGLMVAGKKQGRDAVSRLGVSSSVTVGHAPASEIDRDVDAPTMALNVLFQSHIAELIGDSFAHASLIIFWRGPVS